MATEEKQVPKRRMSKEEKQTHQENVQEKEDLQEEAGEQQKRERLMRKLRRSKSIDLRLLLPPLGLDRTTWRPAPPHPLPRIVCMPCLLRQRASGEVEGPAREVRARSAEEQPSQPDQEVSRGLSLR